VNATMGVGVVSADVGFQIVFGVAFEQFGQLTTVSLRRSSCLPLKLENVSAFENCRDSREKKMPRDRKEQTIGSNGLA
jgi:hypothetical protein